MTATTLTRWKVLGSLSCASFAVHNFGVRTVTGRVPITDAWADVDGTGRPIAVHAALDLAGIDTGNARRDLDLAKPRLLDTGRYPQLVFTGRAAEPDGERWQLPGTLTGHGTSTEIVLVAQIVRRDGDVSVRTSTWFDRRELGITAPRFMIGRRIEVTIDAVLSTRSGPSTEA